MTQRILFVDDEQSLLNGIERRFGTIFDMATANSGELALNKMDSFGPFAVAVTDMRMPKMNGIQFIKEARAAAPDTVYIMLTGNQDQATAIQALNEGHVFRFLTKPCDSNELMKAVEAGLRQYQLVTAEKELLQNTFCGAVSVLTDVLELSHPNIFNRTGRIQEIVETVRTGLKLEQHWEYKLAARLALVGLALMPKDERLVLEFGVHSGDSVNKCFRRAAGIGKRLIEKIPRLETVANIIGMQSEIDGSALIPFAKTEEAKALMGATLLRVAIHWDYLSRQGLRASAVIGEMRRSLPQLSAELINVLNGIPEEEEEDDDAGVQVSPADLKEGMTLARDILTRGDTMLIGKGRRITSTIIERLRCYPANGEELEPIFVTRASLKMPGDLVHA